MKTVQMFSLEKILVPIDFSERSEEAAAYARALARRAGSELTLLHVVEPPYSLGMPEAGAAIFLDTRLAEVQETMDKFLRDAFEGVTVSRVVMEGDPARRIIEYAHSHDMGLILMPTHGYGPFRRFLLGSVTAKVLHDADRPVWTGVHIERPRAADFNLRHVLCAVDLGPQSAKALCWAHRIAQEFGARLTLMNVAPGTQPPAEHYMDQNFPAYLASQAREELRKLQESLNTRAEIEVGSGDPARALHAAVEKLGADLLVIGRSSNNGVMGRLRTSGYAIIRQSPCPVVSV